ncbi:MAG: YggS family pyridoxal phosphate-dependent enzyme, partial [Anaerolineales bacterium]
MKDRIAAAAQRAGRDAAEITLVAVAKTHPATVVSAAAEAGLTDFGENRIEEALPKMASVRAAGVEDHLRWHMIGHVQSRKAREVAHAGFVLVHSVNSFKLAERLSRHAAGSGRAQPILLECNVSGEASKAGFAAWGDPSGWEALLPDAEQILKLPGVRVQGLMTMAPIVRESEAARPFFARLRELRDYLAQRLPDADWRALSMGMTDDFEAAIAEGATILRIGR